MALSFTVGLIVLLLIQLPVVESSFIGDPDRSMMTSAFRLRSDVIGGSADPVLLLDFDDRSLSEMAQGPFEPPIGGMPRVAVAQLLDFIRGAPPAQRPRVVVLDVDIAQQAADGPEGVARLRDALNAWDKAGAPPLVISRQSFSAALFGRPGGVPVLPVSPYDDLVQRSQNIFWGTPKVYGDLNGVIGEFAPFECVATPTGVTPLFSVALIAYQFAERDSQVLDRAGAKHWMQDAVTGCRAKPLSPPQHGETIDYHFSLPVGSTDRVWPNVSSKWPGFKTCGDTSAAIMRRLSVIDVVNALRASDGAASHEMLCQRVVMIGGTNASSADFVQTPLNDMNGSVVLANAIRGLELSHGGLRAIPLLFQMALLLLICIAFTASDLASDRFKEQYRRLRRHRALLSWRERLVYILLNPICLNTAIAASAHLLGIGLMLGTLNLGLWGFVSAPAFAVAISETIQEFLNA